MWRRYGRRKGQKKARADRAAMISDSGWGQGSQSVDQYMSQSVDQAVSGEQRGEVQMEVESGGDSGAAGSSGQSGIDRGESRGDMVGGGSYAEEDDELMLEYMGNEGVGSEEIDKFMGWKTIDLRGETLGRVRDKVRSDTNSKHVATGKRARHQEKRDKYVGVRDRRFRETQSGGGGGSDSD